MSLTNAQYDLLMRDYDRVRLENQRIASDRYAEVCEAVPSFRDLDAQAAQASLVAARKLLAANAAGSKATEGTSEALSDTLSDIARKRKALLLQGGFPADYLDPVYRCPDCKDTGYIDGARCHCLVQASIRLMYSQSHLDAVLERENFDTFDLSLYSEDEIDPTTHKSARQTALEARRIALDFVEHFEDRFENLLLSGPPGTGKTFLTHCIAREVMNRCHSVVYTTAGQLEKLLFDRMRERESSEYDSLLSCDLLIIDDLGTETVNSLNASALYELLNERILRRRSTVISTNKDTGELAGIYSTRIYSRLMGHYRMILFSGSDLRIKKRLRSLS